MSPESETTRKPSAVAPRGSTQKYLVARAGDIPEGQRLIVEVGGRSVGVFNVGGTYYALLNHCPHKGGQLCKGDVIGFVESTGPGDVRLDAGKKLITCPWHGWEYDLETGQSWFAPTRTRARAYPVGVSRGDDVARDIERGASVAPTTRPHFVDAATHRVKGPYTAELFPVTVEQEYVVISMPGERPRTKEA